MEREFYCVCVVSFDNETPELRRLLISLERAIERSGLSLDAFCLVTLDNGDPLNWPSSAIRHVQADRVGNVGFARGSNLLAQKAKQLGKPTALIFANPDGAFHPDCLARLLDANRQHPSDILEARQFPEEHPKSYSKTTGKTEWASGACLLVPMKTFEALNGFDERFFLYMEDIDLSWRARCNNFDVRVVADALYAHNVVNRSESQNALMRHHMAISTYKLALKWGASESVRSRFEREMAMQGGSLSKVEIASLEAEDVPPKASKVCQFALPHLGAARW